MDREIVAKQFDAFFDKEGGRCFVHHLELQNLVDDLEELCKKHSIRDSRRDMIADLWDSLDSEQQRISTVIQKELKELCKKIRETE